MKISINCLFVAILTITGSALAQLDDGKAPVERFLDGYKISGVYDANNVLYCSQKAKTLYVPDLLAADEVVVKLKDGRTTSVQESIKGLNPILKKAMDLLSKNNDKAVENKHVCTGFYHELESPIGNAKSLVKGYIVFDFKLFQYLYTLPDYLRSSWLFDYIALHEFAHQLQYWNNDAEIIKVLFQGQSAKISELSADCTASALLAMMNLGLSEDIYNMSYAGVIGSARALGGEYDPENKDDHGTSDERGSAVVYGEKLISSQKIGIMTGNVKLTSSQMLTACNDYVKNM